MSKTTLDSKLDHLEAGATLTERDYTDLDPRDQLILREAEREVLRRLNPAQRLRRARAGQLSRTQLNAWSALYPSEVPYVNGGIPPWIARTLVDIAEEGMDDG